MWQKVWLLPKSGLTHGLAHESKGPPLGQSHEFKGGFALLKRRHHDGFFFRSLLTMF
jgi:hypothetical protein